MSYYFSLDDLRREMADSHLYSRRFEEMLTFKLNNLKELCGRLPGPREAFFIETKKSFTAFTFIVYLIKHAGRVRHLYIATYSTNERILNALLRWRERGLIDSIHLHVSETLQSVCRRSSPGWSSSITPVYSRCRIPGVIRRLPASTPKRASLW